MDTQDTPRALVTIPDHRQAAQVRAALLRRGVCVVDHTRSTPTWCERESGVHLLVAELHPLAIELARTLQRRCRTVTVFVGHHIEAALLQQATEADAVGVLTTPFDDRQLDTTLRFALLRHTVMQRRIASGRQLLVLGGEALALTPREQEIAFLLLQHKRVPAIAQQLGISPETVRNHLKNAFRRTGTRSQQELLDWLSRHARSSHEDAALSHSGHLAAASADDYQVASRTSSPHRPGRRDADRT